MPECFSVGAHLSRTEKARKKPKKTPDPSPDPAARGRRRTCCPCTCTCKPRAESSSRCGGGGDGGESGGCAVSGSDARTAPPHEVQLQARQASHPYRYGRPSPSSSHPQAAAAPRCSWCCREGKAAACRGSLSGSAVLSLKSWLLFPISLLAFVAKKPGFVLVCILDCLRFLNIPKYSQLIMRL